MAAAALTHSAAFGVPVNVNMDTENIAPSAFMGKQQQQVRCETRRKRGGVAFFFLCCVHLLRVVDVAPPCSAHSSPPSPRSCIYNIRTRSKSTLRTQRVGRGATR